MRNTLEHPITYKEFLSVLDDLLMSVSDDDGIGGIQDFIISALINEMKKPAVYNNTFFDNKHFENHRY